ncbi:hypothetical protein NKH18_40240 [Streptomyces sp. M10(2022)]
MLSGRVRRPGRPSVRRTARRGTTGVSTAFGTFGELLQGVLPGPDGDFLVTLPIARWTVATFRTEPESTTVRVVPDHKRKAARLVSMITEELPLPMGGFLTLDSALPEGKGLASSSADLVATARAAGNALGIPMPPRRIESYLSRIEPTDGVLYDSIVAYDHRRVRLRQALGSLPPMTVVGIDEGASSTLSSSTGFPNRSPRRNTASTHVSWTVSRWPYRTAISWRWEPLPPAAR